MAGNLVKSVMLKIVANDGGTEEKLRQIAEKADELARKHPDIKVKVDSAAASAKLAVLRRELRDTGKAADEDTGKFAALKDGLNVLTLGLSGGYGEMSMFQKVMAGLSIATGLGEPLIAGLTVAVGGLSAGLVSAGAGLGVFGVVAKSVWSGVSSNISAAYAAQQKIAAGATGKNLIADNKALAASLKGLNEGQQSLVMGAANDELSWHKFVTSASGGVASVLVPALNLVPRALQLARGFLAPVEGALRNVVQYVSKGLNSQGFGSFIKMLQVNAGPMIEKLAHAIGNVVIGIGGIIKAFMPVAQRMGSGLEDITGKFAKWGSTLSGHSGFKSLMSMFKSETPLAIGVLKQLGGIIKIVVSQMTGMSTFSNSKMLLQLALPILKLVDALLKAHPQLVWLILYLKLAADSGKKLKGAFEGISGAFGALKTGSKALSDLKSGFGDAESAASDATGAWGSMGGKLSTVLQKLGLMKAAQAEATVATEGETAAQGELDVAMDANPIGLIIVAVAALAGGMYELIKHVTPVRDFFKDLWRDLKNWFMDGVHFVESHWKQLAVILATVLLGPIAGVVVFVATHWDLIKSLTSKLVDDVRGILNWFGRLPGLFLGWWDDVKRVFSDVWHWIVDFVDREISGVKNILSWFGKLGSLFRGWWDDAVNAVVSVVGRLISFVRGIPGKIISGLANLGSLLFDAGKNAILGFIHGMGSMLGEVENVAESIGKSALHGVESFLHIGSPSKLLYDRGLMTAKGFELGIGAGTSGVESAARKMATAAAGGTGVAAGGAGAVNLTLELHVPPGGILPPDFWPQFQNGIRAKGGDPRIVTKKVQFA